MTSPDGRVFYQVHMRAPDGTMPKRRFDRRSDAVAYEATLQTSTAVTYADPKRQQIPFRVLAERFWDAHSHNYAEDATRPGKRSDLDLHILPVLGELLLPAIRPSTITAAIATWSLTLAPGTVARVLKMARQILDTAVSDQILPTNVAKDRTVKMPAAPRRRQVDLTDDQVAALVAAASDDYRPLVIVLAGLGLRISEAAGLRVEDVDWLHRTVNVRQQRRRSGQVGRLKTDDSWRSIPASDAVLEALAEQVARVPRSDGLVFSSTTGRPLSKSIGGHVFDDLEGATWIVCSPHALRHFFATSLIRRGVNVAAVSKWLGDSSPAITWRVYAYAIPSDDDTGRAALNAAAAGFSGKSVIPVSLSGPGA